MYMRNDTARPTRVQEYHAKYCIKYKKLMNCLFDKNIDESCFKPYFYLMHNINVHFSRW